MGAPLLCAARVSEKLGTHNTFATTQFGKTPKKKLGDSPAMPGELLTRA